MDEGRSLSIRCDIPYGIPKPSVFWLYRDAQQTNIIETIRRKHITVDTEGHFILQLYFTVEIKGICYQLSAFFVKDLNLFQ